MLGGLIIPAFIGGYLLIGVRERDTVEASLQQSLVSYADILTLGIREPLWTLNAEAARALVDSVMRDREVFRVRIGHQNQEPFVDVRSSKPQIGKIHSAERDISFRGEHIGRVLIEMDDGKSQQELHKKQLSYILVLAVQSSISLLLIILVLNVRLMAPLRKLMRFSDRLTLGDFDTPLSLPRSDEFGHLGGQFEHMRGSIKQLFDDVRQREERFRTIVTQVPGAVFRYRPDGVVEFVSNTVAAISGYPATAFMTGSGAQTWLNLVNPDDRRRVRQHIAGKIRDCEPYAIEYRIADMDGAERWVSESGQPQCNSDGRAQWIDGIIVDISARKHNEVRIQGLLTEQEAILDNVLVGVMFVRKDMIVSVNRQCESLFGYSPNAMDKQSTAIICPSNQVYDQIGVQSYPQISSGHNYSAEIQLKRRDGSLFWCMMSGSAFDPAVPNQASIWVFTDISERREAEEKLRLAAKVLDNIADGVIVTDPDGRIVTVNPAFTLITGYSLADAIGQTTEMLGSERQDASFYQGIWAEVRVAGFWRGEMWNRRKKNGELYIGCLTINVVRDTAGLSTHYVGVFSDITLVKESQQKLDHLAHHDPLTELPNRLLFNDRLTHAILRSGRDNLQLAVLFIDLDRFKNVNDTLGHHVGDELLKQVSSALVHKVRDGDTLARLGGDEFILLLENIDGPRGATVVAEKLMSVFETPFVIAGHELFLTCSIGISVFPNDGADLNVLIRNADVAMYQAKGRGRNAYRFFSQEMTGEGADQLRLESMLRRSIDNDEIFLNYQPQVDIETGQLIGVEALARWKHPELGLVPPVRFIPLAEESGFINQLGKWVLRESCRQMVRWQEAGLYVPKIAVNLSVRQFERGSIVAIVSSILDETGLEPQRLQLEVTESVIMNTGDAFAFINDLNAIGVGLAIDDFGTGYSSLAYLKQLPVQTLKIDRSFIKDISTDPNDEAIAIAIIQLGKSLNLSVIAEGVETAEQVAFLLRHGCNLAQGYFYSRPAAQQDLFERWKPHSR
ncbi:EAL domain-containing protein [Undibacterium arcticum]